jgi:dTDP-4-dehydrorhamnose reductase
MNEKGAGGMAVNIILLGASGLLGGKVYKRLREKSEFNTYGTYLSHRENEDLFQLLVIDEAQVEELFDKVSPDAVLWSLLSSDFKNESQLTHIGLINVIKHMEKSCKLIYVTTDGFSDGRGNYSEEDVPSYIESSNPVNLYIKAKIEAENIVKGLDDYVIARTGPIYGMDARGRWDKRTRELIENLSRGTEIIRTSNMYKTFVNVDDFAAALVEMIEIDFKGVIHVGPEKKESYYTYNTKLAQKLGSDVSLIRENQLSLEEAHSRSICLDTSMNTSKCREALKTRFRNLDEYQI